MDNKDYDIQKRMYRGVDGLTNWQLNSRLENLLKSYNLIKKINGNNK